MPASSAGLMSGRASRSSWVAKRRSWPKAAVSARNGRWTRSDTVETSSVEGDFWIVALSASGSRENASKVVAISVKRRAWTAATGATMPRGVAELGEEAPQLSRVGRQQLGHRLKRVEQPREPGDRVVEVRAAAGERVAEPGQVGLRGVARRLVEDLVDVVELHRDVGLASGIVSPSLRWSFERPRTNSMYFRPSAERGRTLMVVSTGTSPTFLSSLSLSSAAAVPLGSVIGFRSSTTPMRKPPSRTSLPLTRLAPFVDLHVELPGRDEGQAVVGVVGEEDRDDHDERGDRPDEHGVGDDRLVAAASHGARR